MSGNRAVLELHSRLYRVGPEFVHEEEFDLWIRVVGELLARGGLDDGHTGEVMRDAIGMLVSNDKIESQALLINYVVLFSAYRRRLDQ